MANERLIKLWTEQAKIADHNGLQARRQLEKAGIELPEYSDTLSSVLIPIVQYSTSDNLRQKEKPQSKLRMPDYISIYGRQK